MKKEPMSFELEIGEWLLLTTLISEKPHLYQTEKQKDSDIYDMDLIRQGCAKLIFEESPTQRKYCVSIVGKFTKYIKQGYSCVEFKPFEDQEMSESGS